MFKTTLKEIMNEVYPLEEIETENEFNFRLKSQASNEKVNTLDEIEREVILKLKCQAIKEKGSHSEGFKPYFYDYKKLKSHGKKEVKN